MQMLANGQEERNLVDAFKGRLVRFTRRAGLQGDDKHHSCVAMVSDFKYTKTGNSVNLLLEALDEEDEFRHLLPDRCLAGAPPSPNNPSLLLVCRHSQEWVDARYISNRELSDDLAQAVLSKLARLPILNHTHQSSSTLRRGGDAAAEAEERTGAEEEAAAVCVLLASPLTPRLAPLPLTFAARSLLASCDWPRAIRLSPCVRRPLPALRCRVPTIRSPEGR